MPTNDKYHLTRRDFLHTTAYTAAGLGLAGLPLSMAGCGTAGAQTVHGACYHDCPDRCAWTVSTQNGKMTEFRPSATHPYTAGQLCDKMNNFPDDVTYHPDRILRPLKRVGPKGAGEFVPVSWKEAIGDVAAKMKQIIATHGGEAVLPFSFGGNQGEVQAYAGHRFFAHIEASQLGRTICGSTVVPAIMSVNGTTTGVLPKDTIHSRYIILWGTNPVNSNLHLWLLIQESRANGAKIVVIDPFTSQTARQADWHIRPMPGTDTALALGMMHVILRDGLQDQEYVDQYTSGIEELHSHVQNYTPEETARLTGLESDDIVQLAREYAQASPSLIRVLIGLEHHANGGSACRAAAMLPALTGAWRKQGGGLMNMAYELGGEALNWSGIELPESLQPFDTRTINMIQLGQALTDQSMDPSVQALIVFNANPAVTMPNQNLVIKGLKREDLLTVVLEHFVTDTARYADYVFPATSCLENWDILTSWGTPYLHINEPAIEPLGEARTNTEFFRLLSAAMGYNQEYLHVDDLEIIKSMFDSDHPYLEGITFDRLREEGWARFNIPDPWMPHAEGNFKTPAGKCLFVNPDLPNPLPVYEPLDYTNDELDTYPLRLLTVKSPKHFLNSSHANIDHLRKKEGLPYLDMEKHDAFQRGITDNAKVRVYNARGEVHLRVRISDRVRQGVVCMPQGYWTSLVDGGSTANALTNDELNDLGGGSALHECLVEVAAVPG